MTNLLTVYFMILFSGILGGGCTLDHLRNGHYAGPEKMSREEVLEELNAYTEKDEMDGPLSAEEKLRESNLIPDQEFLKGVPSISKSFMIDSIPSNAPKQLSISHRDTPVKQQDNGKCTAYSGIAGIESLLNKNGVVKGLDLSEWHAWSYYKQYSSNAFIAALTKKRVGDEKDFPQYGKAKASLNPHTFISKQTYIGDSQAAVVRSIMNGNPIYLAMKTPKSMLQCPKAISPFSAASSGGHAILGTGYVIDDKGGVVLEIKNSWGKGCGASGYQYLPLSLCSKAGFYCNMWSLEEVNSLLVPTVPDIDPNPTPAPKPVQFKTVCTRSWKTLFKKVCSQVPL